MKKRIGALSITVLLAGIVALVSFYLGINPPVTNVAGSFAAILAGVIVAAVFKMSDRMYYIILGFVFLASPIGSVLNLYRLWAPYDKIVHFLSGMLIAAFSIIIFWRIVSRKRVEKQQKYKLIGLSVLFAFLGAGAGAGIWEISEFVMDIVASGSMQRGMVDTITDMIAGNLGGLFYCLIIYLMNRVPKSEYDL